MKFSSQEIRYGATLKLHGFHGNRLYDSRDLGGGGGGRPTNSIISRVLLILEH